MNSAHRNRLLGGTNKAHHDRLLGGTNAADRDRLLGGVNEVLPKIKINKRGFSCQPDSLRTQGADATVDGIRGCQRLVHNLVDFAKNFKNKHELMKVKSKIYRAK